MKENSGIYVYDKTRVLVSAKNEYFNEVNRLKEIRWRIAIWIISVDIGIITFIEVTKLPWDLPVCIAIIPVIIIAGVYGIWITRKNKKKISKYKSATQNCRRILGYFEKELFDTDSLIHPLKGINMRSDSHKHTSFLISSAILLSTIGCLYFLFYKIFLGA